MGPAACKFKTATCKAAARLAALDGRNKYSTAKSKPYLLTLEVEGRPFTMEIDTGAKQSIISEQSKNKLCAGKGSGRLTLSSLFLLSQQVVDCGVQLVWV